MSSVFEAGIGQLPKGVDSNLTHFNKAHHLSALDDLHAGAAELVPSFAHPSPGMRESYEASVKPLNDLQIIGAANAGARWGNNADAISKFFNGGHSEDVTSKVDTQLSNFVSGHSETMTTALNTNNRFTNNNRHNA